MPHKPEITVAAVTEDDGRFLVVEERINHQLVLNGRFTLRFAFTGTVSDHKPEQPLDTGIVTTHWLTREQLIERELRLRSPLVMRCVDDYLNGLRQALESVASLDLQSALAVRGIPV